MKKSKKLDKETKKLIKAFASVLVFFLLALAVNDVGSRWYLWTLWAVCAFIWIGVNANE